MISRDFSAHRIRNMLNILPLWPLVDYSFASLTTSLNPTMRGHQSQTKDKNIISEIESKLIFSRNSTKPWSKISLWLQLVN